ncbi:TIGR03084 family metal-binding protein [Dietzia sp. 179-F 9C3 NHS]|uniref:TIGR03084 family metal-binding protein n=1 Tax=Dietzia sp. 179-F 9C3 NHS TaxID=3374295 RepID=UPI00387A40B0
MNDRLDALVEQAGPEAWTTATPAEGWDVGMQIAHLAWTDEVSLTAITDPDAFQGVVEQAMQDPTGFVDVGAAAIAATGRDQVLARWRAARDGLGRALAETDPGTQIPWFGPPMRPRSMATARIMETWAHGTDVADALGTTLDVPEALPHVARLGYRTRGFSYTMHGREAPAAEVRVELVGPDGAVHTFGPDDAPQRVTGSLEDFCLLVTQRVHRADTDLAATGASAEEWLGIAQAFAGLPGDGREEGSRA